MITQMTSAEYQKKYGTQPLVSSPSPTTTQSTTQPVDNGVSGIRGVGVGIAKGALSTVKGIGQLGEKILPPAPAFGSAYSNEATKGGLLDSQNLKAQGTAEKIGKFGEQVAEFAIPGGAVSKATKGLSTIPKIATRALTSGAVATAQQGEIGKGTAIAAGTEAALPIAGKIIRPAVKFMGTLIKGTGSALSGAPSEAIESIFKEGKTAIQTAKEIKQTGGASVLKKNAEKIVNGISKIKQEARRGYGEGLQQLKKEDINPVVFKENIQPILDKFGVVSEKGIRKLGNVEFTDPKNLKTASELINKINKTNLDGGSLRKLADDIENSKYKIATSDERLSFNAFVNELSSSVKNAINNSTDKLKEINKAFTSDMEIAQTAEKIFGKIKYKNLGEIRNAALKLESLFTEKGLDPSIVDNFLERIGVSSSNFKSGEAMRQLSEKGFTSNSIGTSPFEIIRAFTSAVVSPKMVGQIAARTGLAENIIKEMSEKLSPTTRGIIIKSLIGNQQ